MGGSLSNTSTITYYHSQFPSAPTPILNVSPVALSTKFRSRHNSQDLRTASIKIHSRKTSLYIDHVTRIDITEASPNIHIKCSRNQSPISVDFPNTASTTLTSQLSTRQPMSTSTNTTDSESNNRTKLLSINSNSALTSSRFTTYKLINAEISKAKKVKQVRFRCSDEEEEPLDEWNYKSNIQIKSGNILKKSCKILGYTNTQLKDNQ